MTGIKEITGVSLPDTEDYIRATILIPQFMEICEKARLLGIEFATLHIGKSYVEFIDFKNIEDGMRTSTKYTIRNEYMDISKVTWKGDEPIKREGKEWEQWKQWEQQ